MNWKLSGILALLGSATNVTHEICSRAVDRVLHENPDFNTILDDNSDGDWIDKSFTGWDVVFWPDMRPKYAALD